MLQEEGMEPQGTPETESPQTPGGSAPQSQLTGGTGLSPNVAGALCYLLGLVTGVVFLLIEKEDRSVRFHAMQSIIVCGAVIVINIVLGFIPGLNLVLLPLFNLAAFVLWIVLLVKAYQGEEWEVPVLGQIARNQVSKT